MSRERPIKLHIKDGKDTTFRLIGPKGRVLNSLSWDGERLELKDASTDDVKEEPDVIVARNEKGQTESEAVEETQEDHPGKTVVFEDPDTPPPAAPEDGGDTNAGKEENLQNILEDEPPASPVEAPDGGQESGLDLGAIDGIEDVSGESEAAMSDDELADLLEEDTSSLPDTEESPDEPTQAEDSKSEDDEEKKPPQ